MARNKRYASKPPIRIAERIELQRRQRALLVEKARIKKLIAKIDYRQRQRDRLDKQQQRQRD